MKRFTRALLATLLAVTPSLPVAAADFYVSTSGDDAADGSQGTPWKTLTYAIAAIPADGGDTIWVEDGVYSGLVEAKRDFPAMVWIRAKNPYRAVLTAPSNPAVSLKGTLIGLQGFEIVGDPATELTSGLVYVYGAKDCVLRDNIIHDTYYNDLLRVLASDGITVEGNVFYNQATKDEHIDVNGGSQNTFIQDNIFFNDYAGSNRSKPAEAHTFIVIKTSSGTMATGNASIRRNVFFHYEGAKGILRLGSDGDMIIEARKLTVENNLFLYDGDAADGALTILAASDVTVRANTFTGTAVSDEFGGYIGTGQGSPNSDTIFLFNNIFSEPSGKMSRLFVSPTAEVTSGEIRKNLYWNAGASIPSDAADFFDFSADGAATTGDPALASDGSAPLPRWTGTELGGGFSTIRQAFEALVEARAKIGDSSAAIDAADATRMPADDILKRPRNAKPDIGAYEFGAEGTGGGGASGAGGAMGFGGMGGTTGSGGAGANGANSNEEGSCGCAIPGHTGRDEMMLVTLGILLCGMGRRGRRAVGPRRGDEG